MSAGDILLSTWLSTQTSSNEMHPDRGWAGSGGPSIMARLVLWLIHLCVHAVHSVALAFM